MWLLDHGADPNSRCDCDLTPTSYAMLAAPLETIEALFQKGANPLCGKLLHYAVLRDLPDALELVRQLVEQDVPVNELKYENERKTYIEREPFGLGTPLHRAAEFGKGNIVEYLLKIGANPLKLDSRGRTPRFGAEWLRGSGSYSKRGREFFNVNREITDSVPGEENLGYWPLSSSSAVR
jgi:ankyrin repeat protein